MSENQVVPMPDPAYQFEKCMVYETVPETTTDPETGETVTVEVQKPITKTVDGVEVPITGADLEAIQEQIQQAATLGVTCEGCESSITLQPSNDLQGYETVDPNIVSVRLDDGSQRIYCPVCGKPVVLQP